MCWKTHRHSILFARINSCILDQTPASFFRFFPVKIHKCCAEINSTLFHHKVVGFWWEQIHGRDLFISFQAAHEMCALPACLICRISQNVAFSSPFSIGCKLKRLSCYTWNGDGMEMSPGFRFCHSKISECSFSLSDGNQIYSF